MARNVALWGSLFVIALLTFLTVRSAVNNGVDFLVLISIAVLVFMGVGVLGALNASRDE